LLVYELNDCGGGDDDGGGGGGDDDDEICLYHLQTIVISGRNNKYHLIQTQRKPSQKMIL
jgi:hypothetical protein